MHVLTRLHGHGGVIVPAANYRATRIANDDVTLEVQTLEGWEEATIFVEHGLRITPKRFATIAPSEYTGPWKLETSLFSCEWPSGFKLFCDASSGVPFDLLDGDAMVFVQGVFPQERLADREALVGPGQSITAQAEHFIEIAYEHRGVPYVQRHEWKPLGVHRVVVTAQAPEVQKGRAFEGARALLDGLVAT